MTLRIVYDGAGLAGKTTSLRGLAALFGRPVVSPEETLGRTLYFDWLDHELPRIAGKLVRLQIVSVPGQKGLGERRSLLLAAADAIVFVFDSTEYGLPRSLESLKELQEILATALEPRPAIILQINKRDEDGALPLDELRLRLGESADFPLFESVALSSDGLILPLSTAVSLAQKRVEILADRGLLAVGEVGVLDSSGLLDGLQRAEAASLHRGGASEEISVDHGALGRRATAHRFLGQSAFSDEGAKASRDIRLALAQELELGRSALVNLPSPEQLEKARGLLVQGGVWPPVTGPALAAETLALAATRGGLEGAGGSFLKFGPWRAQRLDARSFESRDEAFAVLREWARRCEGEKRILSMHRWLAALLSDDGVWHLWQGIRQEPCLQDLATQRLLEESDAALVLRWAHLAAALLQGIDLLAKSSMALRGDRHSIGLHRSLPVYVDLLPGSQTSKEVLPPVDAQKEIWSMVLAGLSSPRRKVEDLVQALHSQRFNDPTLVSASSEVARVLRRIGETVKTGG